MEGRREGGRSAGGGGREGGVQEGGKEGGVWREIMITSICTYSWKRCD